MLCALLSVCAWVCVHVWEECVCACTCACVCIREKEGELVCVCVCVFVCVCVRERERGKRWYFKAKNMSIADGSDKGGSRTECHVQTFHIVVPMKWIHCQLLSVHFIYVRMNSSRTLYLHRTHSLTWVVMKNLKQDRHPTFRNTTRMHERTCTHAHAHTHTHSEITFECFWIWKKMLLKNIFSLLCPVEWKGVLFVTTCVLI